MWQPKDNVAGTQNVEKPQSKDANQDGAESGQLKNSHGESNAGVLIDVGSDAEYQSPLKMQKQQLTAVNISVS